VMEKWGYDTWMRSATGIWIRHMVEVAWSMGAQVSGDKRDEGRGDMTPGKVEVPFQ
jgi:hypothetical protein